MFDCTLTLHQKRRDRHDFKRICTKTENPVRFFMDLLLVIKCCLTVYKVFHIHINMRWQSRSYNCIYKLCITNTPYFLHFILMK